VWEAGCERLEESMLAIDVVLIFFAQLLSFIFQLIVASLGL
jgi:hypothetical protein